MHCKDYWYKTTKNHTFHWPKEGTFNKEACKLVWDVEEAK